MLAKRFLPAMVSYGATIRMVAEEAGTDTSLPHDHFTNKQGLFDAILQRRADVVNRMCVERMEAYLKARSGKVTMAGGECPLADETSRDDALYLKEKIHVRSSSSG